MRAQRAEQVALVAALIATLLMILLQLRAHFGLLRW